VSLLESERGIRWLDQFTSTERGAAIELADSLDLVSHQQFETGLETTLARLVSDLGAGEYAAFAVRELRPAELIDLPGGNYLGSLDDKKFRPRAVGPGGVGSEGRIAQLIRNLARQHIVLDHPSIRAMTTRKIRHIILVDDFIGSGDRVATFLSHICKHPTIRSRRGALQNRTPVGSSKPHASG
jgi:hypothetical protein